MSTLGDQQAVAVTIYNESLALVRDERRVTLPQGFNRLALRDVSAQINPSTALLKSLSAPGALSVIEQNFNYDLLSPQKLLEKYVGRTITVIHTNPATGREIREQAKVLSTNDGIVLRYPDRIETGIDGRVAFPSLPGNLRDRPTLVVDLNNAAQGPQTLELAYLTSGLSWRADYVGELNAGDARLDLGGFVTLGNSSGTTYRDAKLQLVAGDVNEVQARISPGVAADVYAPTPRPTGGFAQENLFEYHLYTLNRPTTIAENQSKQVALLTAAGVPVRKSLELRGESYYYSQAAGDLGQRIKVGVYVTFVNEGNGLGIPLPKGIMRLYKKDSAGNAQFIGEDEIDHTPRGELVRLFLGSAFDLTANKKQTDFKILPAYWPYIWVYESAYEIVLKNAKSQAVTIQVVEPLYADWVMVEENYPHTKTSAGTAMWAIPVRARGSATLTYRVQVRI